MIYINIPHEFVPADLVLQKDDELRAENETTELPRLTNKKKPINTTSQSQIKSKDSLQSPTHPGYIPPHWCQTAGLLGNRYDWWTLR